MSVVAWGKKQLTSMCSGCKTEVPAISVLTKLGRRVTIIFCPRCDVEPKPKGHR